MTSSERDNRGILFASEMINKMLSQHLRDISAVPRRYFSLRNTCNLAGGLYLLKRNLSSISEKNRVVAGEVRRERLAQCASLLFFFSSCSRQVNLLIAPPPALTWRSAQNVAATPLALIGPRTLHRFARREVTNLSSLARALPPLPHCFHSLPSRHL